MTAYGVYSIRCCSTIVLYALLISCILSIAFPALIFGEADKEKEWSFTQRVSNLIKSTYPDLDVTVISPLTLKLKTKKGREFQANLDNLWKRCNTSPSECGQETDSVVKSIASLSEDDVPLKQSMVRAVLKNSDYLKAAQDVFKGKKVKEAYKILLSHPFIPGTDLYIVYVADYPTRTGLLNAEDLETLKMKESEIHNLALKNLNETFPNIFREEISQSQGIYVVKIGDGYEASLLLLHDRWKEIAKQVKGDLIVAVPTRDLVFFTGSKNSEAVKALRHLARELYSREPYPLTDKLLKWTQSDWIIFNK